MDYPLVPSMSRSNSIRDSDKERDDDDTGTLVDTSNIASTSSRSSRMRLGGYGTATDLATSSSSSFPLVSSTSDSGNTLTAFLAPRLTRHSSNPNPNTSTLSTSSHLGTNIHAHSSSHSHRSASHSHQHPTHEFLYPMHSYGHAGISSRSSAASVSMCSTAANSPINSRAGSPSPFFYSSTGSASSSDEDESEPPSPYLNSAGGTTGGWWREDSTSKSRRRRWPWLVNGGGGLGGLATHPRRRRRMNGFGFRTFKRLIRTTLCRRPLIPKQPGMILLTLLILIAFGTSLTFLLVHILNPDKEPLPWRYYCTVPSTSTAPPSLYPSTSYLSHIKALRNAATNPPPDFPPSDLDIIPPVGVFLGVFSLDSSFERRQLIRTTWASHKRSRYGAGEGDGGLGTSRTIVRFILGEPSKDWERRILLEMETYNDIVIVPMHENMNTGKTHAYFTWASSNAFVPAPITASPSSPSSPVNNPFSFSYSNATFPAPLPADHDPIQIWQERASGHTRPWVRPDFVVKADDDAFVMLAELESRLRVRLHDEVKSEPVGNPPHDDEGDHPIPDPSPKRGKGVSSSPSRSPTSGVRTPAKDTIVDHPAPTVSYPSLHEASVPKRTEDDPLIYWGYLVKNRFMAGELYALSWALVDWVARDPAVKTKIKGAEDKQTAKWVMMHPKAHQVKWASERCWIYDHPRAGTVYSHGFLFPSEVTRVRKFLFSYLDIAPKNLLNRALADPERQHHLNGADGGADEQDQVPSGMDVSVRLGTPLAWAHSSVSTFGVRYSPPIQDMSLWHSIEALVEGSDMSMLREDSPMTPDYAWAHREGRNTRYDNKRVGGTVCVHFIKKNMWFLETATAFLEMQDTTELEIHPSEPDEEQEPMSSDSTSLDPKKPRTRTGSSSGHRESPDPVLVEVESDLVDPDAKKGHDAPIRSIKDMHVLLVQAGAEGLHIDVEGEEGSRTGGSGIFSTDEFEWPEGVPGDDSKRGVGSDAHRKRENERTMTLPPPGHFVNGSKRVNNR